MYCTNCGKPVNETDKFCSQCGNTIKVEEFIPAFMKELKDIEPAAEPVKAEEPKEVKIIHHDEFDWNLDGYPQENRRTDDINFEWESVLNRKIDKGDDVFVGFKTEIDEPATAEEGKQEDDSKDLEEFLFEKEERKPEPLTDTRVMLRKSEEKVDKFYTFNRKNAEFQALLDQEFARLKKAESERHGTVMSEEELKYEGEFAEELEPEVKAESAEEVESAQPEEPAVQPAVEETLGAEETEPAEELEEEPVEETEPAEDTSEEPVAEADTEEPVEAEPVETESVEESTSEEFSEEITETPEIEAKEETPAEIGAAPAETEEAPAEDEKVKEPELVGVVWASAPSGIVVEAPAPAKEMAEEPVEEVKDAPAEEVKEEPAEEPVEENTETAPQEKVLPPSEEAEKPEQKLTFDDVFSDDDDDEDDNKSKPKGKGFLRFITVILCLMVIAELAMIGIQYFAPESQAAAVINHGYTKVLALIKGEKDAPAPAAPETPAVTDDKEMIQQLIDASTAPAENIVKVKYSSEAVFADGEDYGFENFSKTYDFSDAPWYTDDEGETVTYGQEIIGCIIGYYNNMISQLNGIENNMLDYVDQTADYYQTAGEISGEDGAEYGINTLEIGKIRTSGSGFYVRVNADLANSLEGTSEVVESIIYIEPFNKEMKIADKKDL